MPLGAARITLLARSAVAAGRDAVSAYSVNGGAVDTAQYAFGGASLETVDVGTGTDKGINVDPSALDGITTGDFTVECWFRPQSTSISNGVIFFSNRGGGGRRGIHIFSDKVYWSNNGSYNLQSSSFIAAANTWYHLAVVRSGSTVTMYADGSNVGSITETTTFESAVDIHIGHLNTNFGWNGHIDEFRISKTARYTSGFTPSASAFTNDSDTTLLLHMDGTDGSTTFTDDNS